MTRESEHELRQFLKEQDWVVLDDGRAMCSGCFAETRDEIPPPHGADADVFAHWELSRK